MTIRQGISVLLRIMAVVVCIAGVFSGRPPAHGQDDTGLGPNYQQMSPFDAVQNSNIVSLNKHLESTDAAVGRLSDQLVTTQREQSNMEGEQQVYFWVLGLLVTGSIGFQFTKLKRQ